METAGLLELYGVITGRNIKVMFDTGCNLYAVISMACVTKCQLAYKEITKEKVTGWDGSTAGQLTGITSFTLDLQGYSKQVTAYVTESLSGVDLLLGNRWFELEKASTTPANKEITIPPGWTLKANKELPRTAYPASRGLIMKLSKDSASRPICFRATLEDVEKALRAKQPKDLSKLPEQYKDFESLFREDNAASLPPHRESHDLEIRLEEGAELPHGPLYAMTKDELIVLRKELNTLLEKRFITPSSSSTSAPVLFVKKPGGGLRFCIDYRRLNNIVKKDRYPLPLWKETLQTLGRAKWFTKLDVTAAFHRIRVKEGDEWLTAFKTRFGLFQWNVAPFGFVNSPAAFQRFVNTVLQDYLDSFVTAYVDDFLIFSSGSIEDHRTKVKQVLERLDSAGLFLDIDKCEFETKKVKYLGYVIDHGKITMDSKKVEAIKSWRAPTSTKEVRQFLGFANFYRLFIKDYAGTTAPLTALTGKKTAKSPFVWTPIEQRAFEKLKEAFTSAPLLQAFDPDKEARIISDASNWAVGGVFSQRYANNWLPVAYFSRKLQPAECNYPIHDKELLAVVACLKEWDLEARTVKGLEILTDHKGLEYFTTKQTLNQRQAAWHNLISSHQLRFKYTPGEDNGAADALSRRPQDMPDKDDPRLTAREIQLLPKILAGRHEDENGLEALWDEAISQDSEYQQWHKDLEGPGNQWTNKAPVSISECSTQGPRILFRGKQWAPSYEPLRTKIIESFHDSRLAGHPGRVNTAFQIRQQYFWPYLDKEVARYVRNCDLCGSTRIWRDKEGLLKPLEIPDQLWRHIGLDFVVELPQSLDANQRACKHVMVIIDRLSKGLELVPLTSLKTSEVIEQFVDRFIRHHGVPDSIVSDRGAQFTSSMWQGLCQSLGIKQRISTAYHPQTDGATERANAVIKDYIRKFSSVTKDDWATLLATAQLAINNRPAASTGIAPFMLTHGTHAKLIDDLTPQGPTIQLQQSEAARMILERIKKANQWAQASMAASQQVMEANANARRRQSPRYRVGDHVWLATKNSPRTSLDARSTKHRVIEVISPQAVRLDNIPNGAHNVFNVDLIRLAGNNPFNSQQRADPQPGPITTEDGEEEYLVERILQQRTRRGNKEYLVKWTGYLRPTWEPEINLEDSAALDEWETAQRLKERS